MNVERHFANLVECIQLEAEAEAKRMVERRRQRAGGNEERTGETLLNLCIVGEEPSIGGRQVISLRKADPSLALPWSRLRAGTPVLLSSMDERDGEERSGVVSTRDTHQIQIVINSSVQGHRFRLDRSPDEVTRKRQMSALARTQSARGRAARTRDVLLYQREPEFRAFSGTDDADSDAQQLATLNDSQREAVEFALSCQDLGVIHGPPGTGKTTTVVELICRAVSAGMRVLAAGPSNTAVDNLLVRLAARRQRVVRLGHPARVAPALQSNTLDAMVEAHDSQPIIRDMLREAESIYRRLDRHTRAKPGRGVRQELRAEAKQLKSDARQLERQAIEYILDEADVVCCTTTGDDDALGDRTFDLLVVDEACQSTEPGCWIPVHRAERLILAGDHCQLPPTVLSPEAAKRGFDVSLMQRLIEHYGSTVTRRLNVQYRMHQQIMDFSSQQFYDGSLVAHASVAEHTLADLRSVRTDEPLEPVTFYDSAGAGWEEELEPNGLSKLNPEEGRLILKHARRLIEAGLPPSDIAVIAPYAAQVRWLRDHCGVDGLEIDTVDGFQGREKEAVLISLVRSNREGELGFLADARRMNVALTRAKRRLIVVGDSATLGNSEFFLELLEYFEQIGAYHSVWEEME